MREKGEKTDAKLISCEQAGDHTEKHGPDGTVGTITDDELATLLDEGLIREFIDPYEEAWEKLANL